MKTRTPLTQYPLRLPRETYEMLRAEAEARGVSLNALMTSLIDKHLQEHRTELIDLIGRAADERYGLVLDKLADL